MFGLNGVNTLERYLRVTQSLSKTTFTVWYAMRGLKWVPEYFSCLREIWQCLKLNIRSDHWIIFPFVYLALKKEGFLRGWRSHFPGFAFFIASWTTENKKKFSKRVKEKMYWWLHLAWDTRQRRGGGSMGQQHTDVKTNCWAITA